MRVLKATIQVFADSIRRVLQKCPKKSQISSKCCCRNQESHVQIRDRIDKNVFLIRCRCSHIVPMDFITCEWRQYDSVTQFTENEHGLLKMQFDFRKGRSTIDATQVTEDANKAAIRNKLDVDTAPQKRLTSRISSKAQAERPLPSCIEYGF